VDVVIRRGTEKSLAALDIEILKFSFNLFLLQKCLSLTFKFLKRNITTVALLKKYF